LVDLSVEKNGGGKEIGSPLDSPIPTRTPEREKKKRLRSSRRLREEHVGNESGQGRHELE